MNKKVKEIKNVFFECGADVEKICKTIKHFKIYARKGVYKKMFIASSTPSDCRGSLNFRGDVKRWVRSCL
jgi:hypothetical protein